MDYQKKKQSSKNKPEYLNAMKYSNIAFQMIIIIGAGTYGGVTLDEYYETKPVITIILSLFSIFTALYLVLKDFIKPKK